MKFLAHNLYRDSLWGIRLVAHLLLIVTIFGLFSCTSRPEVKTFSPELNAIEQTVPSVTSGVVRSEKIADLAFGTVGRVRKINKEIGDTVAVGEVIAELENSDLASQLRVAHDELQRQQELYRTKGVSVSVLDQARQQYETAKIAFEKSIIRAPFSGTIVRKNLEEGQLSQITAVIPEPLIRMIDDSPRYIRCEIDEVDSGKVRRGLQARVKILAHRQTPYDATVIRILPFVSSTREQDRTVQVDLAIDTEEKLTVGASADVEIIVERHSSVLTVPLQAVVRRGSEAFILKVIDGVLTEQRITLGLTSFTRAEVSSGIQAGDILALPSDVAVGSKVTIVEG